MNIEIIQEKIKGSNDSLFYDGVIAKIGKYILMATGDIEIRKNTGELVFARGKRNADELVFNDDKDLYKQMDSGIYYWEHNNWIEVINGDNWESVLGDSVGGYDEGIELLKQYYTEKVFN